VADNECANDDQWCAFVHQVTHNETLSNIASWLISVPLAVLILVIIGLVARWLACRLIDRLAQRAALGVMPTVAGYGKVGELISEAANPLVVARRKQRADTMASLLKSITTAVIATIVGFMVIAQLGYNIAPLIASAGIIGIALGFGAQSLVKDFISGIFMILEDQFGVGDAVKVGEVTGTVEAVSLRVTRLRDLNGTVWYVRNGEILAVGNMSQSWGRGVLDIHVSYSADVQQVKAILKEEADRLRLDPEFESLIIEEPTVTGLERWDPDGIVVRLMLKTAADQKDTVAREMRARIKARFDAEGIEIPLPQRVVWHRSEPDPAEPAGPG